MAWQDYPCIVKTFRNSGRIWRRLFGDPGGLWVLHWCNEPHCWEPQHLYLGTAADNNRQASREGRLTRPSSYANRMTAMNKDRTGVPLSDTHRAALSKAHEGQVVTAETRAKLSAANSGRKRTPEQRARISVAAKNRRPRQRK